MRFYENEILDKDQSIRELTGGLSKFDGLQVNYNQIIKEKRRRNCSRTQRT
jgi:hypothetical protein